MKTSPATAGFLLLILLFLAPLALWTSREQDLFRMVWALSAEHNTVALTISDVDPDQPPSRFDIDCNGDGIYEYADRGAGSYVCGGKHPGEIIIVIRGRMQHLDLGAAGEMADPDYAAVEEAAWGMADADWREAISSCGGAQLVEIQEWGNNAWVSLRGFFGGCTGFKITDPEPPNLTHTKDLSYMFAGASDFDGPLNHWDTRQVETMQAMFLGAKRFNQPLWRWKVARVKNMERMFSGAERFNQELNLWSTRSLISTFFMFEGAAAFDQPIDDWDTSSVQLMTGMFKGAKAFNRPLGGWDVRQVGSMDQMFMGAERFNQPLGDWDVRHVERMIMMFAGAKAFDQDLSGWKVKAVRYAWEIFKGCPIKKAHRPDLNEGALW